MLCLARIQDYRALSSLFHDTLGISNAGTDDFLQYIEYIKDNVDTDAAQEIISRIPQIYTALENGINETSLHIRWVPVHLQLARSFFERKKITIYRSRFENEKLLYYPTTRSWHKPSSCIWAEDNIQLPNKISLATVYKGKKTFFTNVLGVPKPTLEDHILALKRKSTDPHKDEIMLEIRNICAYAPRPTALDQLSDCKCLPVVYPDGQTDWVDRSGLFAIVDRLKYDELFRGRLTLLAFSLEEVHPLESSCTA